MTPINMLIYKLAELKYTNAKYMMPLALQFAISLVDGLSKRRNNICGVLGTKYGTSSNDNICASFCGLANCTRAKTAVDLNVQVRILFS